VVKERSLTGPLIAVSAAMVFLLAVAGSQVLNRFVNSGK
jgi:hypothetical protein